MNTEERLTNKRSKRDTKILKLLMSLQKKEQFLEYKAKEN